MKSLLNFFFFICFSTATCYAQDGMLDSSMLRLKELKFFSEKAAIEKVFGAPKKITEPKYECGFHSEAEQGQKYYQLVYDNIVFIGNDKEKYIIDSLDFRLDKTLTVRYGKWNLNSKTSVDDFVKIFGEAIREDFIDQEDGTTSMALFFKKGDDAMAFSFEGGYLVAMHYWSPC
ncbi:hypothetical protein [uncultured Pontibacter sp.]|uniref:hypothetical protein n=1 Tax=uncultured Pontibacter sp. TaxID=453356 RepID=UPI0026050535|nr:hypothetical protein [uncultured Pontibacter sp.]